MRFIRFAMLLFAVLLTALSAVGAGLGAGPGASGSDSDPEASRPTLVEISLAVRGEIFAPAGEKAAAVREPIDLEARFEFSDLPVAGAAPEWMSEKAVSIGTYVVSSGIYTVLGVAPPVLGGAAVTQLLTDGAEGVIGAKFAVEPDPEKAALLIRRHIQGKRQALGLSFAEV